MPNPTQPNLPKTEADWQKDCEKSNKTMFLLPVELKGEAEKWKKHFEEQEARRKEYSKSTYFWNKANQEFWCKVREALSSQHPEIWDKDIGTNTFAEADGVFVVNVMDSR